MKETGLTGKIRSTTIAATPDDGKSQRKRRRRFNFPVLPTDSPGGISSSAGSIPDSYDIYRYLNLVRYSIFDTRYFRRKCNFVYIFRGYLKRLRHKKVHKKVDLKNNNNETLRGKRNPDFFSSKMRHFFEDPIFFSKIRFF